MIKNYLDHSLYVSSNLRTGSFYICNKCGIKLFNNASLNKFFGVSSDCEIQLFDETPFTIFF